MVEEKMNENKIKKDEKAEDKKIVGTGEKSEPKTENKSDKKEAPKKQEVKPKETAIVNGISLRISPKYSYAICKSIKGKTPENAIEFLENVIRKKKAVPMNNREIGHRKGKGMMAGRYPANASKEFILLLKQLKANASVNSIDNPVITLIKANRASRPHKREGKRAKRTHVYIEAKDRTKLNKQNKGKK